MLRMILCLTHFIVYANNQWSMVAHSQVKNYLQILAKSDNSKKLKTKTGIEGMIAYTCYVYH